MKKLTLSLAQINVVSANPEENLRKGEKFICEAARRGSDLITFPEMWTTGFDWGYNERVVRDHEKVIERISDMARRYHIWITGSMLKLSKTGRCSNTAVLFDSSGQVTAQYAKAHLYGLLNEDRHMERGDSLCLADTPWGRAGLSICYDIRFPELFRSYAIKGAAMVFSPMAFMYPKLHHWKSLVRARAIEDQLFMIGTNRVGSEDFGKEGAVIYFGASTIVDPWGDVVVEAAENKEELLTASIDLDRVAEVRSKMKVLDDRRPELYELG